MPSPEGIIGLFGQGCHRLTTAGRGVKEAGFSCVYGESLSLEGYFERALLSLLFWCRVEQREGSLLHE